MPRRARRAHSQRHRFPHRSRSKGTTGQSLNVLIGPLLFLSSFWWFLRGLAPGPVPGDAAGLAAAAAMLGVVSAPVHALHLLAGRLMLVVPAGSPAFQLNVLSAAAAAVAALAAAALCRGADGRGTGPAAIVAGLTWTVSGAATWHAVAAGPVAPAIALAAWSLVAARRYADEPRGGWLLLAWLGAGLGGCLHILALAALPAVAWAAWRSGARSARGRTILLAGVMLALPLGVSLQFAPIRAHAHPLLNAGMPDTVARLAAAAAGWPAGIKQLVADHSAGRLAGLMVQHGLAAPWIEMGWLAVLGAWGLIVVRREAAAAGGALLVAAGAAVVCGVVLQDPSIEHEGLLLCWLLAVAAGHGFVWLARRLPPAAAIGLPAALLCWQGWQAAGAVMRDRDFLTSDSVQNLEAGLVPGSRLIAWGNLWIPPLAWARMMQGDERTRRVVSAEDLAVGALARGPLESDPARGFTDLAGLQEGPALFWALARGRPHAPVLLTPEQPPLTLPSRGVRWEGLLLRVTAPGEPTGLAEGQVRRMSRLRLRGWLHPVGAIEPGLVRSAALALHGQAQAALRLRRAADAEALVRIGLRLDPGLPELHQALGRALLAQGRPGAATAFTAALKLTRGTYLDPYLGLAALEPDRDMALEDLHTAAALAVGAQHPDLAEADEARLVGRTDRARRLYARAIATGFVNRGMHYFQEGKLPQAAQAWETALEHDAGQSQACHNLGTLAALEERFDDAIRWYARAREAGPPSRDLEDNLAKAREARLWLPRLPALQRAVEARPRSAAAHCDLGNGYWYVGRARLAEGCYRRAIALDPGDVRAWGNLGSSLVHSGRVREAIEVYTRALKVRPDYAEAMINLAAVYQALGDYVRATDWAQRGLVLKPGDAAGTRILGELAAAAAPPQTRDAPYGAAPPPSAGR